MRIWMYSKVNKNFTIENFKSVFKHTIEDGPSYAEYVKKIRSAAHIISVSSYVFEEIKDHVKELLELKKEWPTIKEGIAYGYDDFLHEQYLIHWKEDCDDFCWAFKPTSVDIDYENMFSRTLNEMLDEHPVNLIEPDSNEIATWFTDSSSFDEKSKRNVTHRTLTRNLILEGKKPFESTMNFRFSRTKIQVSPANTRDSWESTPNTLYTIKRISHKIRQIVREMPNSTMGLSSEESIRRRRVLSKRQIFLMLDLKKCGLTFPHRLLKLTADCIRSRYPNDSDIPYIEGYLNSRVYDKGDWYTPRRGTGLGNANEITTLVLCVIGRIFEKMDPTLRSSLFFNDDGVFCVESGKPIEILQMLDLLYTKLGFIINYKKFIISHSNVFCEDYYRTEEYNLDYSKRQLLIVPIAGVFFQSTPAKAKSFCSSMHNNLLGTGYSLNSLLPLLEDLYPEFFGIDRFLPYHFGGWRDLSNTSFSDSVRFVIEMRSFLGPRLEGYYPMISRWVSYLVSISNIEAKILAGKGKIPYSKSVDNPYMEALLPNKSDEADMFYMLTGIQNPEKQEISLKEILNFRGLKNAKPRLSLGLAMKEHYARKSIMVRFKKIFNTDLKTIGTIPRNAYGAYMVLRYLRGSLATPGNISIPKVFFDRHIKLDPRFTFNRRTIISTPFRKEGPRNDDPRALNKTLESYTAGYLLEGANPYILLDYFKRAMNGHIKSNVPIIRSTFVCPMPIIYRGFCANRMLLQLDYQTKYACMPISVIDSKLVTPDMRFAEFADPIEFLYGPSPVWNKLRSVNKFFRPWILENLKHIPKSKGIDIRLGLSIILDSLKEYEEIFAGINIEATDNREYLNFYQEKVQHDLLDSMFGYRTVDQLMEETRAEIESGAFYDEPADTYTDYISLYREVTEGIEIPEEIKEEEKKRSSPSSSEERFNNFNPDDQDDEYKEDPSPTDSEERFKNFDPDNCDYEEYSSDHERSIPVINENARQFEDEILNEFDALLEDDSINESLSEVRSLSKNRKSEQ